jgi:hypothetical protein
VTASTPFQERPGLTRAELETCLRQCSQAQLEAMLQAIQLRLGSPDERMGDVDCAQLIVHRLNNLLTIQRAEEILRELDELPPGFEPT